MRTNLFILYRACAVLGAATILFGCHGGGDDDDAGPITVVSVPGAPTNLTANVGTTAISLGWDAPTTTGGSSIQAYEVQVTPTVADITYASTHALLQGLTTGTNYTISVRARNSAGTGSATASITRLPKSINAVSYQRLNIINDTSVSGVFDPSVLRLSNGDIWMSYSSVDYHNNASSQLVQDVGIRLARSIDGGLTFSYVATDITTKASPTNATVTDNAGTTCGAPTCSGRWVYETSFLIDDSTDIASRRYKLFAHKYFLYPNSNPAALSPTRYHLGAIVMWTASSLDGSWSNETSLLGWTLTPIELSPLVSINSLHADLSTCLVINEGSASIHDGAIDFAFACPYTSAGGNLQKIVMLRSTTHANSFQYVSTLLTAADAVPIGASYFSAPSLLSTAGNAPVLIATPVFAITPPPRDRYTGCVVIPFADDSNGSLFRVGGLPVGILNAPPQNTATPNDISGACAYDRSLSTLGTSGALGILQSNTISDPKPFSIYATRTGL